jgi:hypothetical protein
MAFYTSIRSGVRMPYSALGATTLIALAAAAPAAALVLWNDSLMSWIVAGTLFAALYLTASLLLRTWTRDDLAGIAKILNQVPGLRRRTLNLERWGR